MLTNKRMLSKFDLGDWWSFGLGLGLLPMPGTMGSLLALPLIFLFKPMPLWSALALFLCVTIMSWFFCMRTYRKLGNIDHSSIVSDEVVGMLFAFAFVPLSVTSIVVGFLLFRVLDILKPWPICVIDGMQNWSGHEVMLDDVLAGVITNVFLQYWFHRSVFSALML